MGRGGVSASFGAVGAGARDCSVQSDVCGREVGLNFSVGDVFAECIVGYAVEVEVQFVCFSCSSSLYGADCHVGSGDRGE
jgi:hypothetical protein